MIYNLSFVINISIHAPHEGERPWPSYSKLVEWIFQSTLPTRGSDKIDEIMAVGANISIHAPHEGERR